MHMTSRAMFPHKPGEVALNLGQGLSGWTLGDQRAPRWEKAPIFRANLRIRSIIPLRLLG